MADRVEVLSDSAPLDPLMVERERIASMEEMVLHLLPFPRAADLWLEQHQRYIKPNTLKGYRNSLRLLKSSLGEVVVKGLPGASHHETT